MKNLLLLFALIAATLISSCSKEDEKPQLTLDIITLEMKYKEIKQLTINNIEDGATTKWSSNDEFIATVSSKGEVTAMHVGKTQIIVTSGDVELICEVIVSPELTLYERPNVEFGESKSYIKQIEKRTLDSETESLLAYKDDKAIAIHYLFEYEKLIVSAVILNLLSTDPEQLVDFLTERYNILGNDGEYFIWTKNNMMIAVTVQSYGIVVMYTDFDASKSLNMQTIAPMSQKSVGDRAKRDEVYTQIKSLINR